MNRPFLAKPHFYFRDGEWWVKWGNRVMTARLLPYLILRFRAVELVTRTSRAPARVR